MLEARTAIIVGTGILAIASVAGCRAETPVTTDCQRTPTSSFCSQPFWVYERPEFNEQKVTICKTQLTIGELIQWNRDHGFYLARRKNAGEAIGNYARLNCPL